MTEWFKTSEKLPEDEIVLVSFWDINEYSIPQRAHYEPVCGHFFSVETPSDFPLFVDLWTYVPKPPSTSISIRRCPNCSQSYEDEC